MKIEDRSFPSALAAPDMLGGGGGGGVLVLTWKMAVSVMLLFMVIVGLGC